MSEANDTPKRHVNTSEGGAAKSARDNNVVSVHPLTAMATRIFNGDSDAESKLVSVFSVYLTKLLHRYFNDHQLCLDLYQETFANVIVKLRLGQVANPELLKSYLSSTALHLGYQCKRQWSNIDNGNSQVLNSLADREPTPYTSVVNGELSNVITESIAKLSRPRDRQLLTGLYLEQKHKSTICNECDLTALQFDRAIYRAKQRLKIVMLKAHLDAYQ